MKKILSVFTLASLLLLSNASFAQSPVDIRINEVQVSNTNGIEDEHGDKCGWIELFNTAFGMVDVAGFYITDDKANPTKYMIPKGNPATQIPLRRYFVLFADGNPAAGVFHMNFTLDGVRDLYLYSTDGKTLLDEIHIPADIAENRSYGRVVDGRGAHEPLNWSKQSYRKSHEDSLIPEDGGFGVLDHPTPGQTNATKAVETKSEKMKQQDPYGGILAMIAMSVVFLCLIILYLCFRSIGKRAIRKQQAEKAAKQAPKAAAVSANPSNVDEEIVAAIAIACHLYQNGQSVDSGIHDVESNVLTFNQDLLRNSPWGARNLTLKQDPRN